MAHSDDRRLTAGRPGTARASPRPALGQLLVNRDFKLLFAGRAVSLVGDGAFLVALAWQAYTLSGAPSALSLLGVAMSVPLLTLLLAGGIASDRKDRRRVMLLADAVRAALLALMGTLALTGRLHLWEMAVVVGLYGAAQAFFDPSSDAILPDIVDESQLAAANAIDQVVRPLALRLAGPAVGGLLIGTIGAGAAFLVDGVSFLASAASLWALSSTCASKAVPVAGRSVSAARELREGWSYVRRHVWLWGTFASAGLAYLLFMGPVEVLLPFIVKHQLGGSGMQLGLVLGAGGLGSVICAIAMLRSGLPSRALVFVYAAWTLATIAVAGYGLATAIWQLMLASLAFNLLETAGTVVWATMKQQRVPGALLGRVSSFDWLISIGLLPLSFALVSPLTALVGARATLLLAGFGGALATLGGLLLPGMLAGEDGVSKPVPNPASLRRSEAS